MKSKIGKTHLALFLISTGLTVFGFWVDSDPPPSLSTTIFEFIMLNAILFAILSSAYLGLAFAFKKLKNLYFQSTKA